MYYGLLSGLYASYRADVVSDYRTKLAAAAGAKDCARVHALDGEVRRWFPDVDPFDEAASCAQPDAPVVITSSAMATVTCFITINAPRETVVR